MSTAIPVLARTLLVIPVLRDSHHYISYCPASIPTPWREKKSSRKRVGENTNGIVAIGEQESTQGE